MKNFISILHSSVFQIIAQSSYKFHTSSINIHNTMSFTRRNNNGAAALNNNPFCKVCYDAGLPTEKYTSHYVKDQPGPNGRVVCPTLLDQKCLICGVPGHTSSYCTQSSSSSSSSSSIVQKEKELPRYAMATDDVRYPPHSIRLPPIQQRPPPRIVYANELQKSTKQPVAPFPNLSSVRRFENNEPQLKRELPAEASPVHSPQPQPQTSSWIQVKYNKKNNPFGILDNNVDSGDDSGDEMPPLPIIQKQTQKQESSSSSSSSTSWASIAAGSKSTKSTVVAASKQPQPQQRGRSRFSIVIPTVISVAPLPLLPPISFKPKPVSAPALELEKKQQVKKMWGDTDSEDDEEFLKRGLN